MFYINLIKLIGLPGLNRQLDTACSHVIGDASVEESPVSGLSVGVVFIVIDG